MSPLLLAIALAAAPANAPAPAPACGASAVPGPEAVERIKAGLARERGEGAKDLPGRTGQAGLRARLPLMPGAEAVAPVGDQVEVGGLPMNMLSFEIGQAAPEVLAFYARYFEQRGWDYSTPVANQEVVPYPAISAAVPQEGLQLSVMVMEHADHQGSTVLLALADMLTLFERGAQDGPRPELADLPAYPGTSPLGVASLDQEVRSYTVSFATADAPAKVLAWYRQALGAQGYVEEPADEPSGPALTARFRSPARRWTLILTRQGGRTEVSAVGQGAELP